MNTSNLSFDEIPHNAKPRVRFNDTLGISKNKKYFIKSENFITQDLLFLLIVIAVMLIWIKIIFFILNSLLIHTTFAYEDVKISKVISVYDGDTLRVNIDSFPDIVGKNIRIRIKDIDAPEIKGKCQKEIDLAIMARDYLRNAINQSSQIELRNIERGKYFRIVGELYIDGENISNNLIKRKLAYYYNGRKKRSWCY